MSRFAWLLLLCLVGLANAAEPEVRVQARLVPATPVMVGATVSLEVDLLVDTWFTAPPELATLQLPGAVVSPPGGEAQHLSQQIDGRAFFGLRYTYRIIPTTAQTFTIPALTFRVRPGQASVLQTVQTTPLSFEVRGAAGGSTEHRLVAQSVELSQSLTPSHTPLRAGDSITRRLQIAAHGAQAMLIPPPAFAEVKGLKRYVQTPSVSPLSDGRGGILGGQRADSVVYVVSAAGRYQLPAIDVQWWDAASGERHTASVPALQVEAGEGVYQAPFSLNEDLRALGRGAQISIAGHGLLLVLLASCVGGLAWAGRTWGRAGWQWLRQWLARLRRAWLDSPGHAWRLARQQSVSEPARLDATYLWLRRATGRRTLSSSEQAENGQSDQVLLAYFQALYAAGRSGGQTRDTRQGLLKVLRQRIAACKPKPRGKHGLKSLNR